MKNTKSLFSIVLFIGGMLSVSFVIYTVSTTPQLSPLEDSLLSILLTILSAITSWVLADFYAKSSGRCEIAQLIDRIGNNQVKKY